jgi:hypothetical protein
LLKPFISITNETNIYYKMNIIYSIKDSIKSSMSLDFKILYEKLQHIISPGFS